MNTAGNTVGEYLKSATDTLNKYSVPTARLDALILMEFILGIDRAKLLSSLNQTITRQHINLFNRAIAKRSKHMPVAYITHRTEFYGRTFYVDSNVLQPRPETETMIDLFKSLVDKVPQYRKSRLLANGLHVADVGTGSGAIGITAKLEVENILLDLIDIDSKALKVAKKNVVIHTIHAKTILVDLLPNKGNAYDILLCNLPYIPDNFHINLAAGHEPSIAIFGGKDGLDVYRKLFKLVSNIQHKPLYIFTEALPSSHSKLKALAAMHDYLLYTSEDFIQLYKLDD
jgi:release factor glutamine methyltransferase